MAAISRGTTTSDKVQGSELRESREFDGAENTGAVLLFDEADSLFGSRSKVTDARDRYANLRFGRADFSGALSESFVRKSGDLFGEHVFGRVGKMFGFYDGF